MSIKLAGCHRNKKKLIWCIGTYCLMNYGLQKRKHHNILIVITNIKDTNFLIPPYKNSQKMSSKINDVFTIKLVTLFFFFFFVKYVTKTICV